MEQSSEYIKRESREVWFGSRELYPGADHWAVRIGQNHWYELNRAGKGDNGKNTINGGTPGQPFQNIRESPLKARCRHDSPIGYTNKTDYKIEQFNKGYLQRHPVYDFHDDNCQHYVFEIVEWLIDREATEKLPPMQEISRNAARSVYSGGSFLDPQLLTIKNIAKDFLDVTGVGSRLKSSSGSMSESSSGKKDSKREKSSSKK